MADAFFTEQHELVRKLAREFAETELTKEILDKVEEEEVFPEEILDKMAKAGFFGIKVPKQYGGQGGDARSYVIVMEEIARVSGVASIYVSSPNSLSGGPFLLSVQIFAELMQNVYYNSVMHYVRIDFLKQYGIDFFDPYYGDCEGMTEAIARAGKMVVMNRLEYVLTTNTSQTAAKVCFYYDTERQWKSIRQVLPENTKGKREILSYVAGRVLDNLVAICQSIVLGEPLTDRYMNPIERGFVERFLRVEKMISNDAMAEMMYWAGRESYAECLLGASGVAYWSLRKQQAVIKMIDENSRWMSRFVHLAMRQDENGEIVWKTWISRADGEQLKTLFERKENRHLIGAELLLRNNVEYEESKQRQDIYEMLKVCIEKGGGCHR